MNDQGPSIKVSEELQKKKQVEEEKLVKQGVTKEKFQAAVKKRISKENLTFVSAVYKTFDEFLEREIEKTSITLACKKGCPGCCYQMVTCTEWEIAEVIEFLKASERRVRQKLLWEVRKGIKKWKKYFKRRAGVLEKRPFQVLVDWLDVPCVFLNRTKGVCNIYPVRIIDCRTSTSLTPCGSGVEAHIPCELDWPGPGRMRFQCEIWANNMILDEEKKKSGHLAVSPILHWLFVKERALL